MLDCVIIGGGPAGSSAALTLGRAHRRVLLADTGEGRNAPAEAVHNFIAHDGTPPRRLRELAGDELARYPTVRRTATEAVAVERLAADRFAVGFAGGDAAECRRVLLATGVRDELPALPGLAELWGGSVLHCPYCHGYEVSGRRIAVLGAGPDRVRLALQLSRFTGDLAVCADGAGPAGELGERLAAHGIAVYPAPVARLDGERGRLRRIVFADGTRLDRDALFVRSVPRPRTDFAARLGCRLLPDGCVEVDDYGRTSVPGVFAAGDAARRPSMPVPAAAVVVAAATGNLAAGAIDQELVGADFGLPAPVATGTRA